MEEIQQRWLCGLSAPMVALNPRAEYDEPAFYSDPEFIDLQCSWGINDRPQLLGMLERMTDNGHATHLEAAYRSWQRCLPGEWQALLETLEPRERILHEFASRTFEGCGSGGIQAWDLGRMGFLLRCAVRNEWIDLSESLWLHWRLAVRAQYHYDDWFAYFNGFLTGRAFWGCLSSSDETLAYELDRQGECSSSLRIARGLSQNMPIFLADLPWHLELDPPQRPASLGEFDWS
ncbi:DUF1266 domain-containing protein [Pseudomonas sp. B21-053]|uniref:DUF1266 domain-containing protein n=1 Tax=Pseudomonas sp. B21-053 TaxID=2895493 RepID=UPI00222F956B|nr:DUF1266 domain-containing protein [Pseudomonas sp. B21-053]UZE14024.1 DUF1266 domain-containing protein [Pseudomonas sp. B21-053]